MKNLTKLGIFPAILFSASSQAMTVGASTAGGLWGSNTDGGIGTSYSYVSGSNVTDGDLPASYQYNYQAEASFNVGALTPVLKAEAYSDDLTPMSDPNISGEAYALQTYQNTSGTTQTITLDLSLDGAVLRAPGSSYIDAEVLIFSGTDIVSDFSMCGGAANYMPGFGAWNCGTEIAMGFDPFIEIASDGSYLVTDSVSFDIAAGETFTLYAELTALTFGGYADAFSTMTMTFDDISNIAALGPMTVIPVPAAVWLFGSGLLGLIGVARRTRRS